MRDFDFVERDTDAYYQAMTDRDLRLVRCSDCWHYGTRQDADGRSIGICRATDEPIDEPDEFFRFEDLDCFGDRF